MRDGKNVAEQRLSGQGVTLRDVVDRVWNVIRMQLRMAVEMPNRIARESTAGKILFVEFNVLSCSPPSTPDFMLNSRASRLRKALNNAIAANTDFILRTFQKYFDQAFRPYSLKDNCTSEQLQPSSRLNLTKISGIFALLCVCLIGSSVAFFTEMIVYLSRRVFGGKRRAVDETTIATMTDQKNREQSIDETSLTAEFVSEEEKRQKSVDETSLTTITASEKEKRMQSVDEGSISTVTTTEMGERAQSMDEASTITTTETEKEKNSINDSSISRSTNAETEKKVQSVDE
ncbi:hypothetical protein PRIPAC_84361, partial [Pristionchus pacificus]|uniref:Uncharacterized protein n=1 Tax=Pristionchus pacificus TaxID=54126 RepID=A0A2A6BTC4_PRIPA